MNIEKEKALKKKLITLSQANLLIKEFEEKKYEGKESKIYYYDLSTLESYIDYIKTNAKQKQIEDLGIRIYLASYPKDGIDRVDPLYNGYNTIVFVPVGNKKNGVKNDSTHDYRQQQAELLSMNLAGMSPPGKVKKTLSKK